MATDTPTSASRTAAAFMEPPSLEEARPTSSNADADQLRDGLRWARVLLALGELGDAEHALAEVLHAAPGDPHALGHYAAIKHRRGELSLAIGCWRELARRHPIVSRQRASSGVHDRERLAKMAEEYERVGTRERLEAALHIHRFLARSGEAHADVDGHLARLHRKLGNVTAAERHEADLLERRRQESFRASAEDIVGLANAHHLPLGALRAAYRSDESGRQRLLSASLSAREVAIVRMLEGELAEASEAFLALGTNLDRLYAADILRERGANEEAFAQTLEAVRGLVDEGRAPSHWSIHHLVGEPRGHRAATVAMADDPKMAAAFTRVLERRVSLEPNDETAWRTLAQLHEGSDAAASLRRRAERAAAVSRAKHPVGRILSAAVHGVDGSPRGLFHELWVTRERTATGGGLPREHVLGHVTEEMTRDVLRVFHAVRAWSHAHLPDRTRDLDDYRYTFQVTKDDEPSGGRSAGLATALAFLSVFTGRPLSSRIAASGTIVVDSHRALLVGRIGDVEHKVLAAYELGLERLLLPSSNRRDLAHSARVPARLVDDHVTYVATFEDAARIAFGNELFE